MSNESGVCSLHKKLNRNMNTIMTEREYRNNLYFKNKRNVFLLKTESSVKYPGLISMLSISSKRINIYTEKFLLNMIKFCWLFVTIASIRLLHPKQTISKKICGNSTRKLTCTFGFFSAVIFAYGWQIR